LGAAATVQPVSDLLVDLTLRLFRRPPHELRIVVLIAQLGVGVDVTQSDSPARGAELPAVGHTRSWFGSVSSLGEGAAGNEPIVRNRANHNLY
jgi:hypothetical protein